MRRVDVTLKDSRDCDLFQKSVFVSLGGKDSNMYRDLTYGLLGFYAYDRKTIEYPYCCRNLVLSTLLRQYSKDIVKVKLPDVPYEQKNVVTALNYLLELRGKGKPIHTKSVVFLPKNNNSKTVIMWSTFDLDTHKVGTQYIEVYNKEDHLYSVKIDNIPELLERFSKHKVFWIFDDNNGTVDVELLRRGRPKRSIQEQISEPGFENYQETKTTVIKQPWDDKK